MIIAVDAAGGEYSPHEIVKGAIKAAQEYDVQIALVGRRDILYVQAGRHLGKLGMSIIDANQVIGYDESPIEAIKNKPNSSIVIGTNLVKEGYASAFVSAGNTGAVLYSALVSLGKIKNIERPAMASIININTTAPSLLIDAGANVNCRPSHLAQFAQLGSSYVREIFNIESPRVSLLNNGTEEGKGNQLARESYNLLKKTDQINFFGNIEGHEITRGATDVIVTDGFTGNILIKTLEGLGDAFLKIRHVGQILSEARHLQGRALLLDVGLGSLVKRMDYREYGGACLLGVNGNIIIAHGRSQAKTIKNAVGLAKQTVEKDIYEKIKEGDYETGTSN